VRQPFVNRFLNFLICLFHHQYEILSGRTLFSLHFTKRGRRRMPTIKEVFLNCRQFLKLLNVLSPCQHGFVKRRSTTTNLLELSSIVINGFKKKMKTDLIYTDFCKSFDSLNHSLLIQIILIKLSQLGFPCNLLTWISS